MFDTNNMLGDTLKLIFTFLRELWNETYAFTICTLFNLKKLRGFLNITEYKIFLIKSFLSTY